MHPVLQKFLQQIPWFIWLLVAGLSAWTLYKGLRMRGESRRLRASFRELEDLVKSTEHHPDVCRGISLSALEEIRRRAQDGSKTVQDWWHRIEHHLQPYGGNTKEHFLARPLRDVLPEAELMEATYHGAQYQALPGIITSMGLAGTFLAILVGLFSVSYNPTDPTQPVKGIDGLINNLSGKFASSLFALALSVIFVLMEKRYEKLNRQAYDRMITHIEDDLPLLTPVRVLVDLQASAVKQEVALRNISSEMVDQFRVAFTTDINPALSQQFSAQLMTELQPTLVKMTETLGTLQGTIQKLETSKHDSLLKDLTVVIQAMHGSLVDSLKGMGAEFHSALSGSTKIELEGMQQSMESARRILDQLSGRFETMQQSFGGMVDQQVLGMHRTVEELGKRVEHMGAQMVETMGAVQFSAQEQTRNSLADLTRVAETAQQGLEATLQRSNREVSQMLSAVGDGTKGFAQAVDKLTKAQSAIEVALEGHLEALEGLKGVGKDVSTLSAQFKSVAEQTKGIVSAQGAGIETIQKQLEKLSVLQEGGGALLKDYDGVFSATHNRLGNLDQDLAKAFGAIHEGMHTWTLSVDACMKALTSQTNEHLAGISRSFGRQIQDLSDKLEDFNEALDRVVEGVGK